MTEDQAENDKRDKKSDLSGCSCFLIIMAGLFLAVIMFACFESLAPNPVSGAACLTDDAIKGRLVGTWSRGLHGRLTFTDDGRVSYVGAPAGLIQFEIFFENGTDENDKVSREEYEKSHYLDYRKSSIQATGRYEVYRMWIVIKWDDINDIYIDPEENFPHAAFVGSAIPFEGSVRHFVKM
ncbi:MAG: hypothetical protein IJM54_03105 [Thermoguttaceae bacterium]|nr:hypothetical protein [Thermoguttaceae bacterium]